MKPIRSTTTGSVHFDAPTVTQTDRFVSTIATQPGVLTYKTIKL